MESGRSLSRYTITSRLGAGGMGEVYRAIDRDLQREVALKVLPEKFAGDDISMERFRREAVLLASVNHPNIATLHGVEEADGIRFIVLELVEGQTLARMLRKGPLPIFDALKIGSQIAKALEAAHKRGVVHRDLKPGNVMVGPDGWVKVLDFGVAKVLQEEETGPVKTVLDFDPETDDGSSGSKMTADLTAVGTLVGTAAYISPEQLEGLSADNRVDIWAFGCVLFECLSGRKAFSGRSNSEIFDSVLYHSPIWDALPAATPAPIRTLLGRCLQKDPDRRLHSISDARIELEEALHPLMAPQVPPPTNPTLHTPTESTLGYLASMGPYSVVERLGAGGYAEVYRAWDRRQGFDVALKVLRPGLVNSPQAREALRREADALQGLEHPNIASWYDFGSTDDLDYLVMEYVPGDSLASKLESGPLPEPEIGRLGAQIARAVAAAHDSGILHRDLKAGNVLITPEGRAKVIDFGIATVIDGDGDRTLDAKPSGAPPSETVNGPLGYLAPEVVSGGQPSEKSDLYSLGVLLYLMATGQRPFAEADSQTLTRAILKETPPRPSKLRETLSPELDRVIRRCLEKDPEQRYASAHEVAEELEAQFPATTVTRLSTLAGRRASQRRKRFGLIALLAVAALAVVGVLAWRDGGWGRPAGHSEIESLVVMPTRVLDEETAVYLTDAIPNSISTHLSRIEGLETRIPPSSVDVSRVGGGLEKVAEAYGVNAMILSTVSTRSGGLALNVQLVGTATRNLLWSEEYEGEPTAYPDLAQRAAEGMRRFLRPGARALTAALSSGDSSEAEVYAQQGLYYSNLYRNRARPNDKERAIAAFEKALELDPERADAAAEIAVLHAASLASGVSILEVLPKIRQWTDRALKIDPRSSRALAVLGEVEGGRTPEDFQRKMRFALRAAAYGPRDGYAHSRLAAPLALFSPSLALEAARQASSVEPLVLTSPLFEALLLTGLGREEEALSRVEYALDIEPGTPFGLLTQAIVLSQVQEEEALELITTRLDPLAERELLPPRWIDLPREFARLGKAVEEGDAEAADQAAAAMVAMARGERPFQRWQLSTGNVPAHLVRFGRNEDALGLLEFRMEAGILPPYEQLLLDERFAPIRSASRFQLCLEDAQRKFERTLAILEEAQAHGELPPYLVSAMANLLERLRVARAQALAA